MEPALQVLQASIIAQRSLRVKTLETAVSEWLAAPNCGRMLVGRNFASMPEADKWAHVARMRLKFELCTATGDLFIISVSESQPHAAAVGELFGQVRSAVIEHGLKAYVGISSGDAEYVAGRINAPDVVIRHKPRAVVGVQPASLILEFEVSHRSTPGLVSILNDYAGAVPPPAYLMGVKIFPRNGALQWAGVAVLWKMATPAAPAAMVGIWSFGPRDVHRSVQATLRAGSTNLPAATAATTFVFTPVGALTINIPVMDLISNHAAAAAAVAAAAGAPGQMTIDLATVRQVLEEEL